MSLVYFMRTIKVKQSANEFIGALRIIPNGANQVTRIVVSRSLDNGENTLPGAYRARLQQG
jgi:hypothetical protein